jgi:hypothetical protein
MGLVLVNQDLRRFVLHLDATRADIHCVDGGAGADKQPVVMVAAEAEIGRDFRYDDCPQWRAVRRVNAHAIQRAVRRPAARGPEIAVLIHADVVGDIGCGTSLKSWNSRPLVSLPLSLTS